VTAVISVDALAGRRALVTGAARGIGEAIARSMASAGADVVIADLNGDAAGAVADALVDEGHKATAVAVDLSQRDTVLDFARSIGQVDVLVNNAAPGQTNTPFLDTPDEEWDIQFALLLTAPRLLSRELGRAMAERGHGAIVNISSASAVRPAAFVAPYAAAKAGVEVLTKVLALELGPRGVRANAVAPTFVPTERNRPVWERVGFSENSGRANPLGRIATPDDVAAVVTWLATDGAAYVNGQIIAVDGGTSAGIFMPPPAPTS